MMQMCRGWSDFQHLRSYMKKHKNQSSVLRKWPLPIADMCNILVTRSDDVKGYSSAVVSNCTRFKACAFHKEDHHRTRVLISCGSTIYPQCIVSH